MMAQQSPPHRRRALIVEDETLIALGLEAEMHALGFPICLLAADPLEASLLAMGEPPDIVLMDVNLKGGSDGIKAAKWLREVSGVPIVFVSGHLDRDTVGRIQQQVPDAPVVPKPVYRDSLADAVREACRAR